MGDKIIIVSYHCYSDDPMYVKSFSDQLDSYRTSKNWLLAQTSVVAERSNYLIVPILNSSGDKNPYNQLKATFDAVEEASAEIALTHTWNSTTNQIQGKVAITFLSQPQSQDVRVGLFVTEDSIIATQSSIYFLNSYKDIYPNLYPKGQTIVDFRHDHVLRAEVLGNSFWGKPLSSGSVSANTEYTVSFDYTVPAKYGTMAPNLNKLSLVAFTCANNGEVYNAVKCKLVDDATAIIVLAEHATESHTGVSISTVGNGRYLLNISKDAVYTIKTYDIRGRIAAQKAQQLNAGKHIVHLINNQWATGLFIVALERNGQIICKERILIDK